MIKCWHGLLYVHFTQIHQELSSPLVISVQCSSCTMSNLLEMNQPPNCVSHLTCSWSSMILIIKCIDMQLIHLSNASCWPELFSLLSWYYIHICLKSKKGNTKLGAQVQNDWNTDHVATMFQAQCWSET